MKKLVALSISLILTSSLYASEGIIECFERVSGEQVRLFKFDTNPVRAEGAGFNKKLKQIEGVYLFAEAYLSDAETREFNLQLNYGRKGNSIIAASTQIRKNHFTNLTHNTLNSSNQMDGVEESVVQVWCSHN